MNDMTPPPRGHNNPPDYDADAYAALKSRVGDFADAAGEWLDLGEIRDEEQAGKIEDFITGARGLWREIDDERKREKEPHLTAGKAVDEAFKGLLGPIEKAVEKTKNLRTNWLRREKNRLDAERAEAQRIAREQAEVAEAARRAAEERNDVIGQAEAEQAAARARGAEDLAAREVRARVTSATGGGRATGLKTRLVAEVDNWNVAARAALEGPNGDAVRAAILTAHNATVRSAIYRAAPHPIPGVKVFEESYS